MARRERDWVWRQVWWPLPLKGDLTLELLDRLAAGAEPSPMVWEARANRGRIRYRVGTRPSHMPALTTLLRELVPGVRLHASAPVRIPVGTSGRVTLGHPALALNVERMAAISRATLASLAGAHQDDDHLVLQVLLGRHLPPQQPASEQQGWFDTLTGARPRPLSPEDRAGLRTRASVHGFRTVIRIGATAATPQREQALVRSLLASLRVAESAGTRLRFDPESPERLNRADRPWRMPNRLSSRELVPLLGWPVGELPLPGVASAHPKHLPAQQTLERERTFGTISDREGEQAVGISSRDSLFHTEVLGPIGSGKSNVLLSLAMADIRAGKSVLVVDPKADLVSDILARIPAERAGDVVVIDPTSAWPVGINPLQDATRDAELVADTLLASFKSVFAETWGIRSEDVLGSALLTLARRPGSTLVELPTLLSDARYRRRVLKGLDDPLGVGRFWAEYDQMPPAAQSALIAPTLNKLRQFLIRPGLRAVLGQAEPAFSLSELFTGRKIVLLSLNKGIVGAESARLLGSLVIGQLWPLILRRAALPPERRHVVSVFIDEVQDYLALPTDLADALAQARSLGVGFTLAHQYRAQLPAEMKAAIDSNARNLIVFGLNQPDAGDIAKMAPELTAEDFMYLPRFQVYARLMHRGHSTGWVSARTAPPPRALRDPVELAAESAARYGRDAAITEKSLRHLLDPERSPATQSEDEEPIGRKKARP